MGGAGGAARRPRMPTGRRDGGRCGRARMPDGLGSPANKDRLVQPLMPALPKAGFRAPMTLTVLPTALTGTWTGT